MWSTREGRIAASIGLDAVGAPKRAYAALQKACVGGSVEGLRREAQRRGCRLHLHPNPEKWRITGRTVSTAPPQHSSGAWVLHMRSMVSHALRTYPDTPPASFATSHDGAPLTNAQGGAWGLDSAPAPQAPPPASVPTCPLPVLGWAGHPTCGDILIPSPVDWELATGRLFPPRRAMPDCDPGDFWKAVKQSPWSKRSPLAVFMGTAEGDGSTPKQNQRLHLHAAAPPALTVSLAPATPVVWDAQGVVTAVVPPPTPQMCVLDAIGRRTWVVVAGTRGWQEWSLAVCAGGVVVVVDPLPSCASPSTWAMPHFDGPYLDGTEDSLPNGASLLRVRADLSNLSATLAWIDAHPDAAGACAATCAALAARVFNVDYMTWYVADVLRCIGEAQGRPHPVLGAPGPHPPRVSAWRG